MDDILSLFGTVTLPNNHAFILKDYLKICTDLQVFVNKTPNDVKPIVTYINGKLNSATNRAEGLNLLQTFLPQCSKDVLRENVIMWLQQCLKLGDGKSNQLTVLSYEIIKMMLKMTEQMPEMRRTVNSIVVQKIIENFRLNIQSESLLAVLDCTETLMCYYGPACGQHKNVLEKILLQHIDSSDKNVVRRLARCMAHIPLLSGGGPMGANHAIRWNQEQQRLCVTLHDILDELLVFAEENPNSYNAKISSTKLPLPEISSDSPIINVCRLVNRFVNVAEILQALLVLKFPAEKPVLPEIILHLVCRGLAVTGKSMSDNAAAENVLTSALLPRIHIALLKTLNSLIICVGRNLLPFGLTICKLVYQTLKWTSTSKWACSVEKPHGELRVAACNTLILWLQTSQCGSCVEIIADKLICNLLADVNPEKAAVTLEEGSPKKGSSKQQKRKPTFVEKNNQGALGSIGMEIYLADPMANSKVCRAALKIMQWLLLAASTFISTAIHEKLQNVSLKLLYGIQKTTRRHSLPVPYNDSHCREELYKLLLMVTLNPHMLRPVPTHQALSIFSSGCLDTNLEVAATCRMGLSTLEKLVHGTRPSQHFPATKEEMMDGMNIQDMEQELEDEAEQLDEEDEEEEEDDDEDEEMEDEVSSIRDSAEIHAPTIQITDTMTLLPDNKTVKEQMEVDEPEHQLRKVESKKLQRPVEKSEANKRKDDEDIVEVLSEEETGWNARKDGKRKIKTEEDEIEDEYEYSSVEEEEIEEAVGDDDELDDEFEDEDDDEEEEEENDSAEVDSEGEYLRHKMAGEISTIKSMPSKPVKKEINVSVSESNREVQKSEESEQLEESENVSSASAENAQSQEKVALPCSTTNEGRTKDLDSSVEEMAEDNAEPSSEISPSNIEENVEQSKITCEVQNATEEEIEETEDKDSDNEKHDTSNENRNEQRLVIETHELEDVENEIAVSIVENKRNFIEYQEVDEQDIHDDDDEEEEEVEEEEELCDEQMEEEIAFENKDNEVSQEGKPDNGAEMLDKSDDVNMDEDKEKSEYEDGVFESVCVSANNEVIHSVSEEVQGEMQPADEHSLKPEISNEVHKEDILKEDGDSRKEDICEIAEANEDSDIPKTDEQMLSDEVCSEKDNIMVDSGNSEAKMVVSEVEAEDTAMDVTAPDAEVKIAPSPMDEDVEEPSRKKMKMDITATLTDRPKAIESDMSTNVSGDVKMNSTGEITKSDRVMNGTATATEELSEEDLLQSFVPEVATDE